MRPILTAALILVTSVSMCAAEITEWSGRTQDVDWEIVDDISIRILADGTFKFQSVTGGTLDAIAGSITIDNSVTGTVDCPHRPEPGR